jgi:GTP-binding protein YchF
MSKLSIGIVGLPNVGKSTLFNALTKKSVDAANYPFCTIDPSVGVVAVPDARLDRLTAFSQSAKTIPAAVEFVDIAGLVKGAAEGEGLGNQFLAHIRETDAIAHVVRIFEDDKVIHVHEGAIDPLRDIEIINLELILADAATVAKRLVAIERDAKRGDKNALAEKAILMRIAEALDAGKPASTVGIEPHQTPIVDSFHLITGKPMLYVLNKRAGGKNLDEEKDSRWQALTAFFEEMNSRYVIVDAGIEAELKDFEGEEKQAFREELGAPTDDGVGDLIRAGYDLLGLITFFTTGPDESRAWTIRKGAEAPEAGAAIHTDFRDKFIRAEVVHCDKLLEAGSYPAARERGLIRTEGKEYTVVDGDVIEFKI